MNEVIMNLYISNLSFVSEKIKNSNIINHEIKLLNYNPEAKKIRGTVNINYKSNEIEMIFFEIKIIKEEDILIFKSKYQNKGKLNETTDTYAITTEQQSFFEKKIKLLIHLTDGKIVDAYCVGKNYAFEKGIHDNLFKVNMNNKDVLNIINQTYIPNKKR